MDKFNLTGKDLVPEQAHEVEEAEPRRRPEFTRTPIRAHIATRVRIRHRIRELGSAAVVARGARPSGSSASDRPVAPPVATGGARSGRRAAAARGQRCTQLCGGGRGGRKRSSKWPLTERSLRRAERPLDADGDGSAARRRLSNHRLEHSAHKPTGLQHAAAAAAATTTTAAAAAEAGVFERAVCDVRRGARATECTRAAVEKSTRTEESVARGASRLSSERRTIAARSDSSRMCQLTELRDRNLELTDNQ